MSNNNLDFLKDYETKKRGMEQNLHHKRDELYNYYLDKSRGISEAFAAFNENKVAQNVLKQGIGLNDGRILYSDFRADRVYIDIDRKPNAFGGSGFEVCPNCSMWIHGHFHETRKDEQEQLAEMIDFIDNWDEHSEVIIGAVREAVLADLSDSVSKYRADLDAVEQEKTRIAELGERKAVAATLHEFSEVANSLRNMIESVDSKIASELDNTSYPFAGNIDEVVDAIAEWEEKTTKILESPRKERMSFDE